VSRRLPAAALIGAALTGCGSGGAATTSSSTAALKLDSRWTALQSCLLGGEHKALGGTLASEGSGQLEVYASDGFVAAISYEGSFARAKAQARRTKPRSRAQVTGGAGAGLAIGNVTYYFTGLVSTPQLQAITGCLVETYRGASRWPAQLDPTSLATTGKSPPGP
jgi:hypothetical protein